jgi:hypothetical protein
MQTGIKVNQNTSERAKSNPHSRFTGIRPKESLENCGWAKFGKAGRMGSQGIHSLTLKRVFSPTAAPRVKSFQPSKQRKNQNSLWRKNSSLATFAEPIDSPLRVVSATLVNTEVRFAGEKGPFCPKRLSVAWRHLPMSVFFGPITDLAGEVSQCLYRPVDAWLTAVSRWPSCSMTCARAVGKVPHLASHILRRLFKKSCKASQAVSAGEVGTGSQQQIRGVAEIGQMTPQIAARSITGEGERAFELAVVARFVTVQFERARFVGQGADGDECPRRSSISRSWRRSR